MIRSKRVAVFVCDELVGDLETARQFAVIEGCNYFYYHGSLYTLVATFGSGAPPYAVVASGLDVGTYLQHAIAGR